MSLFALILILLAYLIGSLSSAIILCKLFHYPDPRQQGSNNPGATNVLRIAGKKVAAFTLLGDMLKGVIPVLIGKYVTNDEVILSLIAIAAFLGHLYPIFFQFKGGKGVATAMGCLLALQPIMGLLAIGTWLITVILFNYSSLASLIFAFAAPAYLYFIANQAIYCYAMMIISLWLIIRHRANIKRLWLGQESKVKK